MSQAKTVKEVLVAARWMIENVGWCQDKYAKYPENATLQTPPCSFCALGAISHVNANSWIRVQATDALQLVVGGSISYWNDSPETTKEQVLQAFDRAIEKTS